MGKTAFICKVDTVAAMANACRSIYKHNTTEMSALGGLYTDDEFRAIDPMRFNVMQKLRAQIGSGVNMACAHKYSRGEDINLASACLVDFNGSVWLEVVNGGGGGCSTLWFERNAPEVGWLGSRGKPSGFAEAPMASNNMQLAELKRLHVQRMGAASA